jgi:hypothetical protein
LSQKFATRPEFQFPASEKRGRDAHMPQVRNRSLRKVAFDKLDPCKNVSWNAARYCDTGPCPDGILEFHAPTMPPDAEMLHTSSALKKILWIAHSPIDAPGNMTGMWKMRQIA